jgi:uncharacterized OB-fold protein
MQRKLPVLTPENKAFWQGGAEGRLLIYRCQACERWFHPPAPICPKCSSRKVGPEPVTGLGKVHSFTINQQAWAPDVAEPYVVAIIELDEQPGLRFISNVVGCAPQEVATDMRVKVSFLQCEDIWLPVFERDG